jgi:nucleoside-diphosphate-sugar epimerase
VVDRENLLTAMREVRADAVMHQLTALGTRKIWEGVQGTNNPRATGTAHLLAAARAVGAHRFLTQSNVFGYGYRDHGPRVITEDDPFAEPAPASSCSFWRSRSIWKTRQVAQAWTGGFTSPKAHS